MVALLMARRHAIIGCTSLSNVLPSVADAENADAERKRHPLEGEPMSVPGLTIEREILIDAPAEVVWRTITEPGQISQWFADRVELVVEPGAHGYMG